MAKDSKISQRRHTALADPGQLQIRARGFADSDWESRLHNLLSPADQAELARISSVLDYPAAGMRIISEGDPLSAIFVIAKGIVRVSRHNHEGQRLVLAFAWPGDLFGMAEGGSYINSADTLAPTTLYRFETATLLNLLLDKPALQMRLLLKAIHDLRTAEHHVIVLGLENAVQRIASFLVDLSHQAEVYDPARGLMRLPLPRSDIADYLGLASETVTRGFKQLEDMGFISRQSPRLLCVRKLNALTRYSRALEE